MDDNYGWLLAQKAEMSALEIEVQGMIALNQYRMGRDETIAYDDHSFQEKADEMRGISEMIMKWR
jgi:hypothetical protein